MSKYNKPTFSMRCTVCGKFMFKNLLGGWVCEDQFDLAHRYPIGRTPQ